jgi:hypothetical protein
VKISSHDELAPEDAWMLNQPLDAADEAMHWCDTAKLGDPVCCIKCGRFHRLGHYRTVGEFHLCPYQGCEGNMLYFWRNYPPNNEPIILGRKYDIQTLEPEPFNAN